MVYRHKVVQGLANLIERYAGKGTDPMMKAVWWGIKGQVPMLLQTLDNNEEAVAEIEKKLRDMLDIEEPEVIVALTQKGEEAASEPELTVELKPKKVKKAKAEESND